MLKSNNHDIYFRDSSVWDIELYEERCAKTDWKCPHISFWSMTCSFSFNRWNVFPTLLSLTSPCGLLWPKWHCADSEPGIKTAFHNFPLLFENLPNHHIKSSELVCWMMKDLWPNCSCFSSWQPASLKTELPSWLTVCWVDEWMFTFEAERTGQLNAKELLTHWIRS